MVIAIKKWSARETKSTGKKSQENKKQQGTKNIKNEEAEKSTPTKWKKPDPKPSLQKPEEKSKSSWLGGLTEKIVPAAKEKSPRAEEAPDEQKKGWFSFSKKEEKNKDKVSKPSDGNKDSFMKPVHLNIEPNPVPRDVLRKQKEGEIQRVRRMCGEFREVVKVTNKEEREEKQKEMEKVRSAR